MFFGLRGGWCASRSMMLMSVPPVPARRRTRQQNGCGHPTKNRRTSASSFRYPGGARTSPAAPSLRGKRVGPHTLRHTAAVHLLRAGVDINTIRAWLGHASPETTNRYAEVDLEMKAKALQACADDATRSCPEVVPAWHADGDLMAFLASL